MNQNMSQSMQDINFLDTTVLIYNINIEIILYQKLTITKHINMVPVTVLKIPNNPLPKARLYATAVSLSVSQTEILICRICDSYYWNYNICLVYKKTDQQS